MLVAIVAAVGTGLISWGANTTKIENNTSAINRVYEDISKQIAAEARVAEANHKGVIARIELLERDKHADTIASLFHFAHVIRMTEVPSIPLIPIVPPPPVPHEPTRFDKAIDILEVALDKAHHGKKFTELTGDEQDTIRSLRARLYLVKAWKAYCEHPAREQFCLDRFGQP